MKVAARREAGIPEEALTFEVVLGTGDTVSDVHWHGGGVPATGSGHRFTTSFDTGGSYTVTATSGATSLTFGVVICPLDTWLAGAREFYGDSIDFSRVRVTTSRAVLGRKGTGWTCNDVIRFKRPRHAEDLPHESTLIHELGHVWEHQTGQMQLLGGLIEQIGRRLGRDPYNYGGPDGVAAARELTAFTKEGQAQILTEYWKSRHGHLKDHRSVPFSTPGYVENLRRLVEDAGIGSAWLRPRRGPGSAIDAFVARFVNGVLGSFETPLIRR
jgi:hypothetical protein